MRSQFDCLRLYEISHKYAENDTRTFSSHYIYIGYQFFFYSPLYLMLGDSAVGTLPESSDTVSRVFVDVTNGIAITLCDSPDIIGGWFELVVTDIFVEER